MDVLQLAQSWVCGKQMAAIIIIIINFLGFYLKNDHFSKIDPFWGTILQISIRIDSCNGHRNQNTQQFHYL